MWVFVSIVIAIIVYFYYRNRHVNQLIDRFPGPKPYPLVGNIPQIRANREELFPKAYKLLSAFSQFPLIRLWIGWRPRLFVLKANAAEVILSSNQMIDKSDTYQYLYKWLGLGLLMSTGSKWQSRRKLITPTFHFKILEQYFPVIVEQSNVLLELWQQKVADEGPTFDIYPYMARCTLDIICETAMGKSVSAQRNVHSPYVKAVNDMAELVTIRAFRPLLHYDWIFDLTSLGAHQKKCLKILHGFTDQVIRERRKEKLAGTSTEWTESDIGQKRRMAFLDMLMEGSSNLSDQDIREEVDTFMFEGHDTTASGISWILYNIAKYPDVQTEVRNELYDILRDDIDRSLTLEDLKSMKYLESVMKESMRLHPPVPIIGRTLNKDTEICGTTVPAGVDIELFTYIIQRDPEYFPDPEKFDPSRFRADNKQSNRNPYAYVPFSAGPRNCIGQKFAMMEEKVVVAQVVRQFWINIKEPLTESDMLAEVVLRPAKGMWLTLKQMSLEQNQL